MGEPTRGGRWIVQQKMPTSGAWTSCLIGCGYEDIADAQADADRCNARGPQEFRVADRWTDEPPEEATDA